LENISFITFTRNSSDKIAGLLAHVKDIVDEIIVIDGFSSDDTVKIAREYGAKVYSRKPWGFVEPDRMFALRMASYDWILYLDDDERLNSKLKEDLKKLIRNSGEKFSAFRINRINLTQNGKPLFGSFYPDKQIRIFKKKNASYKGLVHELPTIEGSIFDLPERYYIIHINNFSWSKQLFYCRLEALMYYTYTAKNLLRRGLWHLGPFSVPLLYFYQICRDLYRNKPINSLALFNSLNLAIYDTFLWIFMHLRTKTETYRAKMVQERGLIQLLKLE
jgi:glycosyltransferase involved in cell wall biosynthesis